MYLIPPRYGTLDTSCTRKPYCDGAAPDRKDTDPRHFSDSRVPLAAALVPETTRATADHIDAIGNLHAHDVRCLLVAELAFDTQAKEGSLEKCERVLYQV